MSILAGFGYAIFVNKLKKYVKSIKLKNVICIIIVGLILCEVLFLQKMPQSVDVIKPKDIPIINYISKDKTTFRTMNLALSALIGQSGYNYMSQVGIGTIKGGSGLWFNDYIEYLIVAQRYNPSKLWGILNGKYVLSKDEINISNLKFIGKFTECKTCANWEAWGPYLYENKEFLPRVYVVKNGILVLGKEELAKQAVYSFLLNEKFNPRTTVIINGERLDDYNIESLKKFKAIILLEGSIDQNSMQILKQYTSSGGILLPNIVKGQNTISQEDLDILFAQFKGNYSKVNITFYSPNRIELDTHGKKGFLVLSERYASFQGWEAVSNGKGLEILKADNAISSIYLDGSIDYIIFEYKPKSYLYGTWITLITFLFLIVFFTYRIFKKYKK
jgi:hypothetical protein